MKHLFFRSAPLSRFCYSRGSLDAHEDVPQNETAEALNPLQQRQQAESQAGAAGEHGDEAVNAALTNTNSILARHEGSYQGHTTYRNIGGFNIATQSGAEEMRATAAAMREARLEAEVAEDELQAEIDRPMPNAAGTEVSEALSGIDKQTAQAEAGVKANTQANVRQAAEAGDKWAQAIGLESKGDFVHTSRA